MEEEEEGGDCVIKDLKRQASSLSLYQRLFLQKPRIDAFGNACSDIAAFVLLPPPLSLSTPNLTPQV